MLRTPITLRSIWASVMMQPSEMIAWRTVAPLILLPEGIADGYKSGPWLEETEGGSKIGQIEIRVEESANRSDVLPIALENVGVTSRV